MYVSSWWYIGAVMLHHVLNLLHSQHWTEANIPEPNQNIGQENRNSISHTKNPLMGDLEVHSCYLVLFSDVNLYSIVVLFEGHSENNLSTILYDIIIKLKMACTAHHVYHNYKQHEWDIYRNVFNVQIIFVLLVGNTKWNHTNWIILAIFNNYSICICLVNY